MTKWGKLAAGGYWLVPKQGFDKAYVTDATLDDLDLVTHDLEELPALDAELDDVLHRHEIELDMGVWGKILEE